MFVNPSIRPDIRPYIRYPALTGYPAGYPVSGFWFSRISGRKSGIRPLPDIRPDIRYPAFGLAGYPVGRISDKISIRCIPIKNFNILFVNSFIKQIGTGSVDPRRIPVWNPVMSKVRLK
jgi:hypothetical protein